jgi:hypothetical protein
MRAAQKGRLTLATVTMTSAAGLFLVATLAMLKNQEPFSTWYYCFAWWSYIVFIEGLLHRRGAGALLFEAPARFLALIPLSTTFWLVFEAFNFRLQNWHYLNVPSQIWLRWLGYFLSFGTVLPGIFATTRLLEHLGVLKRSTIKPLQSPERLSTPLMVLGVASLALPLLWPKFFFPLVWGGFVFILEPVNYRFGAPSLLRDWQEGSLKKLYLLLLGGACCGLLWEMWNFWAGSKWVYTVPYVSWLKVFEMPLLGFLGFPPFALECYALANGFFLLRDRIARECSPKERLATWGAVLVCTLLFDLLVFMGIDRFTVLSFR